MVEYGTAQDLRIEPDPAAIPVPVLDDPVVQPLAVLEVSGESAASPGFNPPVTQEGTAQQREMTAGADRALHGRPAGGNRSRVQRQQRAQDPRRGPEVALTQPGFPQAEVLGLVWLDDQQVHWRAHVHRVVADTLKDFWRQFRKRGQRAGPGVVDGQDPAESPP